MMFRFLPMWLVSGALLISSTQAGSCQSGMQQMSGAPSGNITPTVTNKNHPDAASAAHSAGLTIVPEDFARLRLAPGFLLSLNVLDDSDFAGNFRIDLQGDIAVPILGTIHVGGETAAEAKAQIQKKLLDDEILKNPQVNLTVLEYTAPEVTVVGEVASPGKYPLLAPRGLVDVLALAGGITPMAGNEVQITRGGQGGQPFLVHYSRGTNAEEVEAAIVQPGDTVQVKRAGIVYVLGAVNRPGGYVMQEEGTLSVLQAISLADGTSIAAKTSTMYLLRKNPDGTVVAIEVPYGRMPKGGTADVRLHATDILYVPTSRIKAILTNSQSILSSAASASVYAGLR